jgi:hypothetical protein
LKADERLRPFTGTASVVLSATAVLTALSAARLAIVALLTAGCLLTTLLSRSLILFSLICHVVPPVVR